MNVRKYNFEFNLKQHSCHYFGFFLYNYILCFRVRVFTKKLFSIILSFIIFFTLFRYYYFQQFPLPGNEIIYQKNIFLESFISINLAPWIFQDTSCIFRYSLILHSPLANENLTSISRRKLNDPQFLALQQPRSKLGNDARSCCCWY